MICQGLGNNSGDYERLASSLTEDYGIPCVVAKVSRPDWLRNAAGLLDANYWRGTLRPRPVLDWYSFSLSPPFGSQLRTTAAFNALFLIFASNSVATRYLERVDRAVSEAKQLSEGLLSSSIMFNSKLTGKSELGTEILPLFDFLGTLLTMKQLSFIEFSLLNEVCKL